jgi:hypothetical protein
VETLLKRQSGREIEFGTQSFALQLICLLSMCDKGTGLVSGGFPQVMSRVVCMWMPKGPSNTKKKKYDVL